jgi:hypothetical protein
MECGKPKYGQVWLKIAKIAIKSEDLLAHK